MHPIPRHLALAACLAAGLHGAITASGAAGSPSECRRIADDGARLACYDTLADPPAQATAPPAAAAAMSPAPPSPAAPAAAPAVPAPRSASPQPSAEDLFGRDPVESEGMVRRAAGIDQLDEIRARVARAQLSPYGKLVLTLDNGQVWSQTDSPAPNLKAGDDVRIHRAAMGSYLLTVADAKRTIRVRRSQ